MNFSSLKRWSTLVVSFLAGQGSVQLLNLISGFLLLRWLSVEDYAQYSIAFGFQSTIVMLIELGFSGSIIALVGDRGWDQKVVGNYISSAKYFRNRTFAVIIPLAAIAFPLITFKHHWNWITQLLLFVSIVGSVFFQGWVSYYSVPILINQQIRQYYQPQIISSAGRVVVCFILYLASALSSWTTAWVSSAVYAVNGLLYRQATTSLVIEPKKSDPKLNQEMLRYILPLIPALIFTAFQNQISLVIITLFGQTKSIAEVAALGRLGQLFMILGASNAVIIGPYIAKVAHEHLYKKYFHFLGVAMIVAAILSAFAFLFPQPLLWVLGSKYYGLTSEVGWAVTASSFSYLANVLYSMNASRKWIYWWGSAFEISLILIIQVICISLMNLNTTLNVIYFSAIVAVAYFILHFVIGGYGLVQNYRLVLSMKK